MTSIRKILNLPVLVLFVAIAAVFLVRSYRAGAQADLERSIRVPIIVSPSAQPGKGQALLFKATNISAEPVDFLLNIFNETDGVPVESTQFPAIPPRVTVTHLYNPPQRTLVLNGTTFEVPQAVRAIVAPLPAGEPGAIRRVVATLQMVSLKPANAPSPSLDPPIFVPLERCLFKPTGFVPYTGARYVWDCAPTL